MLEKIPIIDNLDAPGAIDVLGNAFRDIGFVFIRTERLYRSLPWVYGESRKVFCKMSGEEKNHYVRPDLFYQRGYTPLFTEKAIACRGVGDDGQDLANAYEGWFTGPEEESIPSELREKYPFYPVNIWPEEVPTFRGTTLWAYDQLYDIGSKVLQAIGRYLTKPEGYFDRMIRHSPTVLRDLYYPPVAGRQILACQHTDINLITILPASTQSGLWIRRRDGTWIPAVAPSGYSIAQVADMLDYDTGGYFISAAHEVRAPEQTMMEGRFSLALFIHARSDFLFQPQVDEGLRLTYPPITAHDLLLQRLKAIGLA